MEVGEPAGSPSDMEVVERHAMFGGEMLTFTHLSASCGFAMRCRAFTPPGFSSEAPATWPCLVALGGLTASEVNFATKVATVQRAAAERGLVVIFPDTSPRGQQDDPHPLLGEGASYYVDATEAGWGNWKMFSYVTKDLPDLVVSSFRGDRARIGIMGHSMGGQGAIVAFLRSDAFVSCSAFAPVSNPSAIGPGTAPAWRAFSEYLGGGDAEAPDDAPWRDAWRSYDACELLKRYDGPPKKLLVDQGAADPKLKVLGSERLKDAANDKVQLTYRLQEGYDHELGCFVASFAEEHVHYHADAVAPRSALAALRAFLYV